MKRKNEYAYENGELGEEELRQLLRETKYREPSSKWRTADAPGR